MSGAGGRPGRGAAALAMLMFLAGCAAPPTPVCKGPYRPFDSRQLCHPGP